MNNENGLSKTEFLQKNYQLPDKSKQFLKLTPGNNVVRFLTSPLTGWVFFNTDNKPTRRKYDVNDSNLGDFSKNELTELKAKKGDNGEFEGSRHFWIVLVWDRESSSPKILEITQISILKPLVSLYNDKDWGDLRDYDVNIHREGAGKLDTEFSISPKPHKDLSKQISEVLEVLKEKKLLDMNAIWEGNYPFEKYLF